MKYIIFIWVLLLLPMHAYCMEVSREIKEDEKYLNMQKTIQQIYAISEDVLTIKESEKKDIKRIFLATKVVSTYTKNQPFILSSYEIFRDLCLVNDAEMYGICNHLRDAHFSACVKDCAQECQRYLNKKIDMYLDDIESSNQGYASFYAHSFDARKRLITQLEQHVIEYTQENELPLPIQALYNSWREIRQLRRELRQARTQEIYNKIRCNLLEVYVGIVKPEAADVIDLLQAARLGEKLIERTG